MSLSKANLLVVDDEPALRLLLKKWLTVLGCKEVYVAADGAAALELLRSKPIDLVLTDVSMPVMDGIVLVHSIAKAARYVPSIVFLSGYGDVDKRKMYGLGVEAFIAKPFEYPDLEKVLKNSLAERSSLWRTEMASAPRQVMCTHVKNLGMRAAQDAICLGRGGFSVVPNCALSLGKVSFRCSFENEEQEMAGDGYVRWKSQVDRSVGIEFSHLDAFCHAWVTTKIMENSPRCFIPHA